MKTVTIFFGIFAILIIIFLILITWQIPIHNANLRQLNKNFESSISLHPLVSKKLLQFSDFGNFGESGGQCGYIVGEFRISPLTKEEIINHYKNSVIDSFKQGEVIPLEVYFLDDSNFAHYPLSKLASNLYQKTRLPVQSPLIYLITASSYNHLADGDIRCSI